MKPLLILGIMTVVFFVGHVSAQQPAAPSPEDQLLMTTTKLRWLEQSRTQCENSLADIWGQASRLEMQVKQLQDDKQRLADELKTLKDSPRVPTTQ